MTKCNACRAYADHLIDLETNLRMALHTRWDHYRPNLNLQAIKNPSPAKLVWNSFFSQTQALGKVTIIAALLLGYIAIVNLIGIRIPISTDETPTALPTPNGFTSTSASSPTPSIQSTLTDWTSRSCKTIIYVVQENDTLDSIAVQHGITPETILEYNKDVDSLASDKVFLGMELVIPLCEKAPSRTASLPGSVLTITPISGTIFPDQPE